MHKDDDNSLSGLIESLKKLTEELTELEQKLATMALSENDED
jgi:hypothetical protein